MPWKHLHKLFATLLQSTPSFKTVDQKRESKLALIAVNRFKVIVWVAAYQSFFCGANFFHSASPPFLYICEARAIYRLSLIPPTIVPLILKRERRNSSSLLGSVCIECSGRRNGFSGRKEKLESASEWETRDIMSQCRKMRVWKNTMGASSGVRENLFSAERKIMSDAVGCRSRSYCCVCHFFVGSGFAPRLILAKPLFNEKWWKCQCDGKLGRWLGIKKRFNIYTHHFRELTGDDNFIFWKWLGCILHQEFLIHGVHTSKANLCCNFSYPPARGEGKVNILCK